MASKSLFSSPSWIIWVNIVDKYLVTGRRWFCHQNNSVFNVSFISRGAQQSTSSRVCPIGHLPLFQNESSVRPFICRKMSLICMKVNLNWFRREIGSDREAKDNLEIPLFFAATGLLFTSGPLWEQMLIKGIASCSPWIVWLKRVFALGTCSDQSPLQNLRFF